MEYLDAIKCLGKKPQQQQLSPVTSLAGVSLNSCHQLEHCAQSLFFIQPNSTNEFIEATSSLAKLNKKAQLQLSHGCYNEPVTKTSTPDAHL